MYTITYTLRYKIKQTGYEITLFCAAKISKTGNQHNTIMITEPASQAKFIFYVPAKNTVDDVIAYVIDIEQYSVYRRCKCTFPVFFLLFTVSRYGTPNTFDLYKFHPIHDVSSVPFHSLCVYVCVCVVCVCALAYFAFSFLLFSCFLIVTHFSYITF